MGGLLSKFLTDKQAEKIGVWVEYTSVVNDDGTYPAFKIKRISTSNVSYQAKINKPLREMDALAKKDNYSATEFLRINKVLAEIFVDEILVDWKNLKGSASVDENGQVIVDGEGVPVCEEVPYSKEYAKEFLCNPDTAELLKWLMEQSSDISNFLEANREKNLKS